MSVSVLVLLHVLASDLGQGMSGKQSSIETAAIRRDTYSMNSTTGSSSRIESWLHDSQPISRGEVYSLKAKKYKLGLKSSKFLHISNLFSYAFLPH